jgi:predicted DNA-binding transcriptional regulator AlpA
MLPTTLEAVKSILRADPSVTTPDRARLLALLRNGEPDKEPTAPAPERIIRRRETAQRLGCSLRAIDTWAKQGLLAKIKLPGRVRSAGFRERDIIALIQSRGTPA